LIFDRVPLLVGFTIVAAAGCGGGDDHTINPGPPGACEFLTGSASTKVTADDGCINCSIAGAEHAIDGDLYVSADVTATYNAPNCGLLNCEPQKGIAIRAIAQPGIVFPSGKHAGAWLTLPPGSWSFSVRTYLSGSRQEESALVNSNSDNQENDSLVAYQATKPFDAVEIFVIKGSAGSDQTMQVQEICSDFPFAYPQR